MYRCPYEITHWWRTRTKSPLSSMPVPPSLWKNNRVNAFLTEFFIVLYIRTKLQWVERFENEKAVFGGRNHPSPQQWRTGHHISLNIDFSQLKMISLHSSLNSASLGIMGPTSQWVERFENETTVVGGRNNPAPQKHTYRTQYLPQYRSCMASSDTIEFLIEFCIVQYNGTTVQVSGKVRKRKKQLSVEK
jgi:hypothetical protein